MINAPWYFRWLTGGCVAMAGLSPVAREIAFDNSENDFLSTNVQEAIEEALLFQPLRSLITYDDTWFTLNWSPATSGTGASALQGGGNATFASGKHNGVMLLSTGTTTTGRAAMKVSGTQQAAMVVGNGKADYESLVYIEDLATVAEDYKLHIGIADTNVGAFADAILFEYDRSSSVNWRCVTASASSQTVSTTSTAVVADTWLRLGWRVNEAGTSVTCYINGVSVATITTNIPVTTGRGMGPLFEIIKEAGTTSRSLYSDYFFYVKIFTSRD